MAAADASAGLSAAGGSTGAQAARLPGSRFGLGLDLWAEGLDGFENTWAETTVTQPDANGTVTTTVIPGDPALNNRKFDYRWELRTFGAQVPVALPDFPFGRLGRLYPRLTLEAARVEATFEVLDRTGGGADLHRQGEGTLWGLGLDLVGRFGEEDRWFAGGGYRYRQLSNLDLSSALPQAGPPTFPPTASTAVQLPFEEVRLDRREHAVTARVGRAFGDRVFPYLGIRGRLADLEVEDSLDIHSPLQGLDFQVRSSSRFENDAVLAVGGVDARLGPLVLHVEAAAADSDWSALVKLVYARWPEAISSEEIRRTEHAKRRERWLRRAAAISAALVPLLEEVERRFLERRRELESGPYGPGDVEALLDVTEEDLLEVLGRFEDLGALRAYAKDFFRRQREQVRADGGGTSLGRSPPPAGGARPVALAGPRHAPGAPALVPPPPEERGGWGRLLDAVGGFLSALVTGAREDELYIEVEISASDPPLRLCPGDVSLACLRGEKSCDCREGEEAVWRGLHLYRFKFPQNLEVDSRVDCQAYVQRNCDQPSLRCDPETPDVRGTSPQYVECTDADAACRLDLWEAPSPLVRCSVSEPPCGCRGVRSTAEGGE